MAQTTFPIISEITIDSIAGYCNYEFGMKKGEFEQAVFHANRWMSRVRRGESKMNDYHYTSLFNLLKVKINQEDASFISTMKRWYPALAQYTSESDIIGAIRANLDGTASETIPVITDNAISSISFIEACQKHTSPIRIIKMAAQTGWRWFDDHKRTDLLTKLAQNGISIQVIGNPTSPTMKKIARAMRDPTKELRYMGINSTLAKWHEYEKAYPSINFRVSDYPILRQTLIVEFEDNSSRALIRDYAYGSPVERLSPHKIVYCQEPDFEYYDTEFDFLWNNSQTYDQWYESLPEPEETLQPGNYILLYPSHGNHVDNCDKWIFSALSISDSNTASLKVNISDSLEDIESDKCWEYSYQGNLKLTRNTIFISLYDMDQQEEINISLVRPLRAKNRYIGIMTALSPSGQPVAFKCACIGRAILQKLSYSMLNELLSHNNKEWGKNLLALENQDINTFYSDRIFVDKTR